MLVISIELWPYGDRGKAKQIAVGRIVNDGTGTMDSGNYTAEFQVEWGSKMQQWRAAKLLAFPRKERTAWELLRALLADEQSTYCRPAQKPRKKTPTKKAAARLYSRKSSTS